MNIKRIKIVFGLLLLGAAIGVLLSLTVFGDVHKIEKINVAEESGRVYYTSRNGKALDGVVMIEDGQEKGARINIRVKNGLRNGLTMQFNGDAKKIAEYPFVEGILDGPVKYYESNGSISGICMYTNGVKNGKEIVYLDDHRVSEAVFENGVLTSFASFGPDEKVSREITRNAAGEYEEWEYIGDLDKQERVQVEFKALPEFLPEPLIP